MAPPETMNEQPGERHDAPDHARTGLRCPTCGYNLTGLVTSRCPECGDSFVVIGGYEHWRKKNLFYYQELSRLFRRHVPPGGRVLEIGCQAGDLLADLQPQHGVGIEGTDELLCLARQRNPRFTYYSSLDEIPRGETFDFVVISNALAEVHDVQTLLSATLQFCRPDTRVVLGYYNASWEPILKLASRLGLRRPTGPQNWLSRFDLENLLLLSGFQTVRQFTEILIPKRVPPLTWLANRFFVKFWPLRHLALQVVTVARPAIPALQPEESRVSVIIPTRNEKGNIEAAIQRAPEMGAGTELIFVDGWSTDGTPDEIRRCIDAFPGRTIRLIAQEGPKGKGQAVRQGFETATGDVLMILDADLTVAPEDLPKFFEALAAGKGEFINGTRLVYPMEQEAMRFLNKLGNRFFSILFTWLIGQRFRDTLCGTKVMTRRSYARIASTRAEIGLLDPFGDFDLIFGAARNDLKILEIPVRYGARTYGQTNIARFRDGWLLLRMSWKAFWKLRLR